MDSAEFQVRGRQMVDFIIKYLEVAASYSTLSPYLVLTSISNPKSQIPNKKYHDCAFRTLRVAG